MGRRDLSATLRLGAGCSRMTGGSPPSPLLLGCLLLAAGLAGALAARPSSVPTRKGAASCPLNWLYHRGYCYGYFVQRRTWAEAEEECRRYGPKGRLASLHSAGATRVLARYVSSQRDKDNTWVGLYDKEHSRGWKWSDDSVIDYTNWAPGQPDNQWDKEDCVVLDVFSGFKLWHDYPCNVKFPFLCQHEL
ncbi:C-type Lectin CRL-like [Caloenas nicobarica]|uniref:C-type Lectin CRL-like n=1 Tax=Caloenas nicobarica TaxID=187106 RepID=UPI0032B7497E